MSKLKEKGITLVALVVTVIILFILAGVTISQIGGNNGLFSRVRQAVGQYKNASLDEESSIKEIEKHLSEFEVLGGDKTDEGVKVKITNFEANQEGKNIKAVVTIEGTASKIEYSLDGETWVRDEENETNTEYIFKEVKIGSYNVRVRVYDEEGKKTEAISLVTMVDTDIETAKEEDIYMELIWTNPNKGESFSAKKVSIDLSQYSMVAIKCFNDYRPNSLLVVPQISFAKMGTTTFLTFAFLGVNCETRPWQHYRKITVNTDGIEFGDAYFVGQSSGIANDEAIPDEIYGIKKDISKWF